jgi:hypothetical protein
MAFNNEIEEVKAQIKVLQAKLELLKEMEKHKTPCEEAYKRVYTYYPVTDITDPCWDGSTWTHFANGYKSAQEDYKVGEFQPTPQEPEELKTLYQMFEDEGAYGQLYYDNALKVVRGFLMDEGVIKYEDEEYITITLQKSLLEVTND